MKVLQRSASYFISKFGRTTSSTAIGTSSSTVAVLVSPPSSPLQQASSDNGQTKTEAVPRSPVGTSSPSTSVSAGTIPTRHRQAHKFSGESIDSIPSQPGGIYSSVTLDFLLPLLIRARTEESTSDVAGSRWGRGPRKVSVEALIAGRKVFI